MQPDQLRGPGFAFARPAFEQARGVHDLRRARKGPATLRVSGGTTYGSRHHQEADGPAADKDAAGKVSYRAAAIASGGGSMGQKMEKEHFKFEFQSRN
ncbi:MAG: hypothetical protein DMG11_29840 [Acidobacteria bacterium]|nr:MAG: hypothetical protein DMG11_29840 [Acidobacteriota bacterium]